MRGVNRRVLKRWIGLLLFVLVGAAVWLVGASRGFPSTHGLVHGFYVDTMGLTVAQANDAAAVTRKGFHIPAYALVAFVAWFALPRRVRWPAACLAAVLFVAIGDEWLQSMQPSRSGKWQDVLVDLIGGVLGMFLAARLTSRREAISSTE